MFTLANIVSIYFTWITNTLLLLPRYLMNFVNGSFKELYKVTYDSQTIETIERLELYLIKDL
jgi:hypothetical protein